MRFAMNSFVDLLILSGLSDDSAAGSEASRKRLRPFGDHWANFRINFGFETCLRLALPLHRAPRSQTFRREAVNRGRL
jgi:hypothetical protein